MSYCIGHTSDVTYPCALITGHKFKFTIHKLQVIGNNSQVMSHIAYVTNQYPQLMDSKELVTNYWIKYHMSHVMGHMSHVIIHGSQVIDLRELIIFY